ncbi:tyrosine-type recombinase/integrase [Prevotella sp.]
MEKVLLKSVNFNIRSDKDKDNYTLIYLVVYIGANGINKQYKLPFAKVIAKFWDKKQHLPILTAKGMTEDVKQQQLFVNQLITDIKCALCVGNSYTIDEIRKIIEDKSINIISQKDHGSLKNKGYITGVTDKESNNKEKLPNCQVLTKFNNKMVVTPQFLKAKRTPKATNAIKRVMEQWKESNTIAKKTKDHYIGEMKIWLSWVNDTNQRDGYSLFCANAIFDFRDYIAKKNKAKNTNEKVRTLCQAINLLAKNEGRKRGIKKVDISIFKLDVCESDSFVREEILQEDFDKLNAIECNEKEEFYRKLFIFQTLIGQRISDTNTILQGKYTLKDNVLRVRNKKASRIAKKEEKKSLVLMTDEISELMEYFKEHYTYMSNENLQITANFYLKKLFKKAGITRISKNGKPLCEEITTHYARHTFCTRMRRKGFSFEYVAMMMGCGVEMVKRIYQHLSEDDEAKKLLDAAKKIA